MIVTIDGPTASGKSTAAEAVARKLGFYYLNSGFLFRALAYALIHHHGYSVARMHDPDLRDVQRCLNPQHLTYTYDPQTGPHVMVDGTDVTSFLKNATIDEASSLIGTNGTMRGLIAGVQRAIAAHHDVVTDGRDAGTVIFPEAQHKFYLTAPLEVRVRRTLHDQESRGTRVSWEEAYKNLCLRDKRDSERAVAPLRVAEGAVTIDNGALSIDETVEAILAVVKHPGDPTRTP